MRDGRITEKQVNLYSFTDGNHIFRYFVILFNILQMLKSKSCTSLILTKVLLQNTTLTSLLFILAIVLNDSCHSSLKIGCISLKALHCRRYCKASLKALSKGETHTDSATIKYSSRAGLQFKASSKGSSIILLTTMKRFHRNTSTLIK